MGLRATAIEFIVHDAIALLLYALGVQNASSESVISSVGRQEVFLSPTPRVMISYAVTNLMSGR